MIVGIGSDLVDIRRIQKTIETYGDKFLNRIFTPAERARAEGLEPDKKGAYYAKRYAAKEAVSKAMGSGIGRLAGWQEIETLNNDAGAPAVHLSGQTAESLRVLAGTDARVFISLSDEYKYAMATVVIEKIA